MRKNIRQSMIVNNFFTLASIVIISITLTLYNKFILQDEANIDNLSCQELSYSTAKVFNKKLLKDSIKAFDKGYYRLDGGYIKPIYSKPFMEEFLSLDEVDSYYRKAIGIEEKKDIKKFINIKYELIENDRKDPNKKSKNCKLHSGSVQTSFRAGNIEFFRYYTDFALYNKDEIKSKIDCTIKVYKNYVKNFN